jgi:uroporphyrinogen-III synthase
VAILRGESTEGREVPGPHVGVTAARKGAELATERRGATVLLGPTLGGARPADDTTLAATIDRLASRKPRWFAASTGMGMRLLGESAERPGRRDTLVGVLETATVVARGLKATGGLRRLGIEPVWTSPDERDGQVEAWLASRVEPGDVLVVQVHGAGAHPYDLLTDVGADLEVVAPYLSAPPGRPEAGHPARPGRRHTRAGCGDLHRPRRGQRAGRPGSRRGDR